MKKWLTVKNVVITMFVSLYLIVSVISTIHAVDLFELTNPRNIAIWLAIAFEFGQLAVLAGLLILDKLDKNLVWAIFIVLTTFQIMANGFYSYINIFESGMQDWSELMALNELNIVTQKRILSGVTGGILPLIALGFIKSLLDYIKPSNDDSKEQLEVEDNDDSKEQPEPEFEVEDFDDSKEQLEPKHLNEESDVSLIEQPEPEFEVEDNNDLNDGSVISTNREMIESLSNDEDIDEEFSNKNRTDFEKKSVIQNNNNS